MLSLQDFLFLGCQMILISCKEFNFMLDNEVFTQTRVPEKYSHQIEDYHSAVIQKKSFLTDFVSPCRYVFDLDSPWQNSNLYPETPNSLPSPWDSNVGTMGFQRAKSMDWWGKTWENSRTSRTLGLWWNMGIVSRELTHHSCAVDICRY